MACVDDTDFLQVHDAAVKEGHGVVSELAVLAQLGQDPLGNARVEVGLAKDVQPKLLRIGQLNRDTKGFEPSSSLRNSYIRQTKVNNFHFTYVPSDLRHDLLCPGIGHTRLSRTMGEIRARVVFKFFFQFFLSILGPPCCGKKGAG